MISHKLTKEMTSALSHSFGYDNVPKKSYGITMVQTTRMNEQKLIEGAKQTTYVNNNSINNENCFLKIKYGFERWFITPFCTTHF